MHFSFLVIMYSIFGPKELTHTNHVLDQLEPTTHSSQPIVTGSTVIGIKYSDGVMMASDTLASYGSLARYKDMRRLKTVGKDTLIGASGEMSDFQSVMNMLDGK